MNWKCPRILYFNDFRPRAQWYLPIFFSFFFSISHDLLARYRWPALSLRFLPCFRSGFHSRQLEHLAISWSIGAPGWSTFFTGAPSHFNFFFPNSRTGPPPPIFSLLLTTMPSDSCSVTTSLHCIGSPPVGVLCESDCLSSACVVQLERKKKKRVSVIVGNNHQSPPPSHDYHSPPSSHHHHSPPTNAIQSRTNANQSPTNANQLRTNVHQWPTSNHHKKAPINDHQLPLLPSSNDPRSPSKDQSTNAFQSLTNTLQSPTNAHQSPTNAHQLPTSNHHKKAPIDDQQLP
jgi:hypothetical protein